MGEWRDIVNTDQAFDFLREAGVTEDICIQTVRRWLRERKINYEGNGLQKSGYILEDTDQAFDMLLDAGVPQSMSTQLVRRWLREGKIQNVGNGTRENESIPKENAIKRGANTDQDKMIRQFKVKIKAQEEHIEGMEKLHQNSINTLIQQRNKLKMEIAHIDKEKNELQKEMKKLLQENITLRNEMLKLKEELSRGSKKEQEQQAHTPPPPMQTHHRHKLGLSRTASSKDVLAGYKKLLKITHPDHGGNAAAFHYIKADYDQFRSTIKEK
jgi:regulator of replication initiation timing